MSHSRAHCISRRLMVLWLLLLAAISTRVEATIIHVDMANGTAVQQPAPSYIAYVYTGTNANVATGVLIAPRFVLTTAKTSSLALSVTLNTTKPLGLDGERISVIRTFVHPFFNRSSLSFDLGVLQLDHDSKSTPAPLSFDYCPRDTKATVRGFGRVQYDQKADILRESSGHVLSNDDCINMNDPSGKAPNDLMCIIGPYPCMGDAGGPVTIVNKDGQEVVVAVQSWTSDKCMGDFGGYVRLSNAVEFFKPFLRGQDVCQQNLVRPTLLSQLTR
ncbi:hypothetical protein Ae201684P_019346 [Aphanomyces euteiches]|uniref:Peptidase S1 domain-containing protein n=1 Tax=Aphanomyces euteiches TaxID=100861 RepID=A0A6G0XDN3_9STRA|nr:hypothetical protein Ae201684_005775 [Aphanomyces euteiches]KAH9078255.1 hypothetical protein Ae201684P_019346 [Aphanomyces euteiches]KAH9138410.1 hypothetical protein AeRB84_017275 [Aphanomyces euteiches]